MMGSPTPMKGRSKRQKSWQEISVGVALSLLFHGSIILIAVVSVWIGGGEVEEPETLEVVFDDVELLAFGEEIDSDMMPRLTGDEGSPPPPPDDVVDVEPEPDVDPEPDTEPDVEPEIDTEPEPDLEALRREREAEERRQREEEEQRRQEDRQRRMDEALGRFDADGRGDAAPQGSSDGVAGGTSMDADRMETYQERLFREIGNHRDTPTTISESEVDRLGAQVRVQVYFTADGHIESYEVRQSSDNDQFNGSIERVLRVFMKEHGGQQLPLPESSEVRQAVLDRGLLLRRWGTQ